MEVCLASMERSQLNEASVQGETRETADFDACSAKPKGAMLPAQLSLIVDYGTVP